MISLPSWSLKSSRAYRHKPIKIRDEQNVADGVGMLFPASRWVYPSPSCRRSNSSYLQPCVKACQWAVEIVSELTSSLPHRRTEAACGRPAPFASRQVELRGVVPAPELPVGLKLLLHVTGFSCLILSPAPALQVSPKNTPFVSQLIAQIP